MTWSVGQLFEELFGISTGWTKRLKRLDEDNG